MLALGNASVALLQGAAREAAGHLQRLLMGEPAPAIANNAYDANPPVGDVELDSFFQNHNARADSIVAQAALAAAAPRAPRLANPGPVQVLPAADAGNGNHRKRKRKPAHEPSAEWPQQERGFCCKHKCCQLYTQSLVNKIRCRSAKYWFDDVGNRQTNQSANRKAFTRSRATRPSADRGQARWDIPS